MMRESSLLAALNSVLENSEICGDVEIVETEIFSSQQFSFKIRTKILSDYSLQVRIYFNRGHYDYAYQLFAKQPILRWDNKEHFLLLKTFPHHYHSSDGQVEESPLKGEPVSDLKIVLEEIKKFLACSLLLGSKISASSIGDVPFLVKQILEFDSHLHFTSNLLAL